MKYQLKDWLNSINSTKENLMEDDPEAKKDYNSYIINRCLSGNIDCILFVNQLNLNSHLDADMQYSFLINTLRKRKRYSPWIHKEVIEDLECVKQYYGYSNEKASQALKLLNKEQLNFIKQRLDKGGTK
jgi:hypothetical protein